MLEYSNDFDGSDIDTPLGKERNKNGLFYNFLSFSYNFIGIFQ